ncbi:MAG: DNA endonuclease SmrA [Cellvibrionaceae bacterium]
MSEDDDFLKAMGDVKPIKSDKRVILQKKSLHQSSFDARRESAQAATAKPSDPLAENDVKQLDPNDILDFRRSGVQHGVYKQLRLGRYSIDARLDLHRMTVEQARQSVYQFIRDCIAHDIRCALITHGKGEGRKNPAVLKSYLAHWLPQISEVLAFHSAQKQHGGTGASYLLLKKSEKKRQENLEKHQRRR